jgi:nucleoside-diphosphate-sugar epimerase
MVSLEEAKVPPCILLTGVTGFVGKVVLEELLRRREELQLAKAIVVIRSKRGRDPSNRFLKELAPSPCFSQLPAGWADTVQVIEGDLRKFNCGLNKIDYESICSRVTHIIHCAGSVKFDLPLAEAAASNIDFTLNIYELAQDCPRLQRLVVTSTAYVTPHTPGPILELLPPLPRPASQILEEIRDGDLEEKRLLRETGHPNTYTLTKCIAEHLISERHGSIPVTIVRPSIVSASLNYPYPGWIDSLATLSAFVIAFGSGLMRVFDGKLETVVDVVPVDAVAQKLINETFNATRNKSEPNIVYAVATVRNGTGVEVVKGSIMEFSNRKPGQPAARLYYCGPRNCAFYFHDLLQHRIRFFFAGLYYACRGDKRRQEHVKRGAQMVSSINHMFPYFIHNTFDFRPEESILGEFDAKEYMNLVCSGVERHLTTKYS